MYKAGISSGRPSYIVKKRNMTGGAVVGHVLQPAASKKGCSMCARGKEWGTGGHVQESQEHTARAEVDPRGLENTG
jgi:hypothetical protein